MPASDVFTYTALASSSYRLLKLQLDEAHQPLQGDLLQHVIGDAPSYLCLSYAWGSTVEQTASIDIQGQKLGITNAVAAALRWIREHQKTETGKASVYVWIDSVCISQEDLEERAQQVRHMKRIFSEAQEVVVYLGEEKNGSEDIPTLYGQIWQAYYDTSGNGAPASKRVAMKNLTLRQLDETGLPNRDDAVWEANRAFLGRSWFLRTWIVQEAVLARKLTFVCGGWGVPTCVEEGTLGLVAGWHILLGAQLPYISVSIAETKRTHNPAGRAIHQIKLMLDLGMGKGHEGKRTPSLIDVLQNSRQALATDPRDHIFGVLGLVSEASARQIPVDYTQSVPSIYRSVAETIISGGDGAKLLYNIHGLQSRYDLPTWVPDWSAQPVPFIALAPSNNIDRSEIPYVCAGGDGPAEMRIMPGGKALLCKGYIVDEIERLARPWFDEDVENKENMKSEYRHKDNLEVSESEQTGGKDVDVQEGIPSKRKAKDSLLLFISDLRLLLQEKSAYPPDAHEDVIWRTLVWNRKITEQRKADASYRSLYESFMRVARVRTTDNRDEILAYNPNIRALDREVGFIIPGSVAATITLQKLLEEEDRAWKFENWASTLCAQMRGCRTAKGYLGQVPQTARFGDVVCVLQGVAVPFMIRRSEDERGWQLLGQCYLHGFMEGEALNDPTLGEEDILLV